MKINLTPVNRNSCCIYSNKHQSFCARPIGEFIQMNEVRAHNIAQTLMNLLMNPSPKLVDIGEKEGNILLIHKKGRINTVYTYNPDKCILSCKNGVVAVGSLAPSNISAKDIAEGIFPPLDLTNVLLDSEWAIVKQLFENYLQR